MGQTFKGMVNVVKDDNKSVVIRLNPDAPSVSVGEHRVAELVAKDDGNGAVWLRVGSDPSGPRGSLTVYSHGLTIHDSSGHEVVRFNCDEHLFSVGGNSHPGTIVLCDGDGKPQATFVADTGGFSVGSSLRYEELDEKAEQRAILRVGHGGRDGIVHMRDHHGQETISFDGGSGDVVFHNADCAEDFDLAVGAAAEPGTVMVVDDEGKVRPSERAYDAHVVGVVSGAGRCRPGIVLDCRPRDGAHATVGLIGKVYCLVDADAAPIRAGSLLVTADRAGYAQAALDAGRAFGAVLGKALAAQERGLGLVPVLVGLK